MTVKKNYILEDDIGNFLPIIYKKATIIHNKQFEDTKFRPDYVIKEEKLIVEYDGPRHFTLAKTVLDDDRKDIVYQQYNYRIIRIPYFIQLHSNTIKHFFNVELAPYNSFPHGFISDKVILPGDFCLYGLNKYSLLLDRLSKDCPEVVNDINLSLNDKVNKGHPIQECFPLKYIKDYL